MSKQKILEPTPYPNKISQNIISQNGNNPSDSQSQLKAVKNELSSLENKYENLMKLFTKSEKKLKERSEEIIKLKQSNEAYLKKNNLQKKGIEKIRGKYCPP